MNWFIYWTCSQIFNFVYYGVYYDCISAIDGVHVLVVVPAHKKILYIWRKGYPTMNCICACDFKQLFTLFVLDGKTQPMTHIFLDILYTIFLKFPKPPRRGWENIVQVWIIDIAYARYTQVKNKYEEFRRNRYHWSRVMTIGFEDATSGVVVDNATWASVAKVNNAFLTSLFQCSLEFYC